MKCLLVLAFVTCGILGFISCKDKKQEMYLQESLKRLDQQNSNTTDRNQSLRNAFLGLMYKNYMMTRIGYLEKDAKGLFSNSDTLLLEITNSKKSNIKFNKQLIFKRYAIFQSSLEYFKKRIAGSLRGNLPNININGFMNLDEKQFNQKYFGNVDLKDIHTQLLLLEADALMNEAAFLENTISYITPIICGFSSLKAFAITNNCIYKKGDKLKVSAFVGEYLNDFPGYAVIDGQKIEQSDGLFNYSRIITESPGLYKVPVKIIETSANNRQEVYPADVTFRVE